MNNMNQSTEQPSYRIGAVSRLTGVASDTLRAWERCYGTVAPFRSDTGTRLYSSLTAFEAYSEECEVLNVEDAALHAFLHSDTAQARSLLETALAHVVEADDIPIEGEKRSNG